VLRSFRRRGVESHRIDVRTQQLAVDTHEILDILRRSAAVLPVVTAGPDDARTAPSADESEPFRDFGSRVAPPDRQALLRVVDAIPVDAGGGSSPVKTLVLADLIIRHGLSRFVEIGVYRGRVLLPIAKLMSARGDGEAVGIDPYSAAAAAQHDAHPVAIDLAQWPREVDWEAIWRAVNSTIDTLRLRDHCRVVRARSAEVADEFGPASIDLLHIDGNHDRADVTQDVELFVPKVKAGGFVVLDDVTWPSVRSAYEGLTRDHELVFQLFDSHPEAADLGSNDFAVFRVKAAMAEAERPSEAAESSPPPPGSFAEFVASYQLPARDPRQPRPVPSAATRTQLSAHRTRRARDQHRRLAYLDSTFPWRRSGFRYHEAEALLELRPDTLFFSLWDLTDPFPAPVHRLSDFSEIALAEGITDAYGVFLVLLEGLLGLNPRGTAPPHVMVGPDLSRTLRDAQIKLHGTIYPGGGFNLGGDGLERARALALRLDTTFSYVVELLEHVPGITPIPQALTNTSFYLPSDDRWAQAEPLVCMHAGDSSPRKGLDAAIQAFQELDPDRYHLHVVGPSQARSRELPAGMGTFHGWMSPEELRDLHQRVHVMVSPVSTDELGMVDGFPTQVAADAMSTGCLLVSANPTADHRILTPGVHYIECPPDSQALRDTLRELAGDPLRVRRIADAGMQRVRSRTDIRVGTAQKLAHMGLGERP
jgi:glycosyltransferase involved in cell wall biosynthesis